MAGRLEQEIKKVMQASQGSPQLAQRMLVSAVLKDSDMLRELAAPYLKALTAQAIAHTVRKSMPLAANAPTANNKTGKISPRLLPEDLRAGYNPMRAAMSVGARPEASSRHISTLKLLAAAYQVKRGAQV